MKTKCDLAVIGGGPGGLVVASVAAQLGLRVILAEKSDRLGGDCLHHGCVPSKTLIRSARVAHLMRNGARYGLPAWEPEIDLNKVVDRIESVIADIQRHDDPERFRAYGCDVRFAPARFTGPHELQIGADVVTARRCVIATGSQPAVPPIPGLQEAGYDTNETIFSCRQLPPRLAIIGAGPIGVELAQAYARLGSRVTLIEQSARVLPAADADIAESLSGVLRDEGITLRTAVQVTHVRRDGDCRQLFLDDDSTVECERVLVATGRRAAIFGLGLEAAGVDHTPGSIVVDRRLRTSQKHIYAVGDVCGPYPFTHMAEYQAGVVLANLLFRIPRKVDYRVVPWVTYTDPEVAHVGLTQMDADARGLKYDVARFELAEIDRAKTDTAVEGFARILISRGRIAGASLVGAHAGELVHELALAMRVKARVRDIAGLVHAYPTYSQIHRRAINARYSQLLYSRKTRFLVRLIRTLLP